MNLTQAQRSARTPAAWLRVYLLAAVAAAAHASAAAQSPAPDACLQAELATQPEFSGVVLLRQRGQVRLAAQGTADGTGTGTALRADSRFNLGSASKMFTAVAVAQLVEQGKLALDEPIGRWVEGLAPPVAAVTLRQLLTHSGGIGNFMVPDNLAALQRAKTVGEQMALVDDTRTQFEPGKRFRYSNTGFLLLGRAVERASGQSFAAYLTQRVFQPAGMGQTSLDPSQPTQAVTGFTRLPPWLPGGGPGPSGPGGAGGPAGPIPSAGTTPMPRLPPPAPSGPLRPADEAALPGSPAGSVYSTLGDLARFFDALQAGKLVSAAWVQELTRGQIDASPPGATAAGATPALQYGLGFGVSTWEGRRSFGHNGGAPGVNVEALRFPDDEVLIVVLSNRDPPMAAQRLASLRRAVFGGSLCR
jgi:CubicO group peptidase (beta-lactamase class C family)